MTADNSLSILRPTDLEQLWFFKRSQTLSFSTPTSFSTPCTPPYAKRAQETLSMRTDVIKDGASPSLVCLLSINHPSLWAASSQSPFFYSATATLLIQTNLVALHNISKITPSLYSLGKLFIYFLSSWPSPVLFPPRTGTQSWVCCTTKPNATIHFPKC